jgi:hypothetical protein
VGLQRLLLRGNSIGDAGAAALCAQLSAFPDLKLQELDLGDNQVNPAEINIHPLPTQYVNSGQCCCLAIAADDAIVSMSYFEIMVVVTLRDEAIAGHTCAACGIA